VAELKTAGGRRAGSDGARPPRRDELEELVIGNRRRDPRQGGTSMANECVTFVYVTGPSEQVAQMRQLIPLDFEAILPTPHDLAPVVRGSLTIGGSYLWRLDAWGCKSQPWEQKLFLDDGDRLGLWMETPWAPPSGILRTLSERLHALELACVFHDTEAPNAGAFRLVDGLFLDAEQWPLEPVCSHRDPYDAAYCG
jgi:hypothetical protein